MSTCLKHSYNTKAEAQVMMTALRDLDARLGKYRTGTKLNVYLCKTCFAWHVGNKGSRRMTKGPKHAVNSDRR
jgi:hypothetical protein